MSVVAPPPPLTAPPSYNTANHKPAGITRLGTSGAPPPPIPTITSIKGAAPRFAAPPTAALPPSSVHAKGYKAPATAPVVLPPKKTMHPVYKVVAPPVKLAAPAAAKRPALRGPDRAPASKDIPKNGSSSPVGETLCFDTSALLELTSDSLRWIMQNNKVIFPKMVLSELDKHIGNFKKSEDLKRAAKGVRELLISEPCILQSHLDRDETYEAQLGNDASPDDHIVACAFFFAKKLQPRKVFLISDDRMMKVKARGEHIPVADLNELVQWPTFKAEAAKLDK